MSLSLVLIFIFMGHVLGDFYFQTDKIVQKRREQYGAVLKHGVIYTLVMLVTLFVGVSNVLDSIKLCILTGVFHLGIDSAKFLYEKKWKESNPWITKHLFEIDQVIHLFSIIIAWFAFGRDSSVRDFFTIKIGALPILPVVFVFGILSILRPIGIWISESDLRKYNAQKDNTKDIKHAGKIIGYWERVIVFILLLYGQFGAIGFVLTAKSVARFKEIELNQELAEYYLIGTLMSMGMVLGIWAILGLF